MNRSSLTDSSNALDVWDRNSHPRWMANTDEFVFLHRVDPSRNMARFYALSLAPNLFGETSLFRNWGRIGNSGQTMIETFSDEREAADALRRLHIKKGRRGYRRPA